MNVWAAPRDDLAKARPLTRETDRPIFEHWFARTNAHLLFCKDSDGDENLSLWCVGLDGSAACNLMPDPGVLTILLGMHYDDPHLIAVGMNDRDAQWHDVYVLDIRTGERWLVYENIDEVTSFILDQRLHLKLATAMRGRGGGSAILKWNGVDFDEIMSIEPDDVLGTAPLHVNCVGDAWFLRSSVGRDKSVILRVDWASGTEMLLASHDKADIAEWITDPRSGEVTAVSAEYLRRSWIAIDPATGQDLVRLEREFGASVSIESQSDDDKFWIVCTERPDRPHAWHLLDRGTGKSTFLFSARPELAEVRLAAVQDVIIRARDGLDLVSYLTLPAAEPGPRPVQPLPLVLLVHGGPWARDSWSFNREVQWLANRNYAVLQVNYRGSAGFGKRFAHAGDHEWAGKMHADLIDAVEWAIAEGIADRKRMAIYGASYGGYAALVGAAFTPDVFCCSVSVAGIANLETMLANSPPYWVDFAEQEYRQIGDPGTPEGIALLRARSPLHRAGDITRPMLIGHGANDVRCKVSESDQIVAAVSGKRIPVVYVVYPDEGHEFARPENDIAFKAIMEAFLARLLGGRAETIGDDFVGSSHKIRAGGDYLQEILAGAEAQKRT